jgi:hypothetical protein
VLYQAEPLPDSWLVPTFLRVYATTLGWANRAVGTKVGTKLRIFPSFSLHKKAHVRCHPLAKIISEMRVPGCRPQVGMPHPLRYQVSGHSILLQHRNAAMAKSVEPRRSQIQLLQNLVQLAPHVAFRERRAGASLEHSAAFALSHVCGQHLRQSRFDIDPSVSPPCLDRNLFSIPDATANVDSVGGKIQVFNMQPECFPTSQTGASQCREQNFPLAACGVDDLKHFVRTEASLLFLRNLW